MLKPRRGGRCIVCRERTYRWAGALPRRGESFGGSRLHLTCVYCATTLPDRDATVPDDEFLPRFAQRPYVLQIEPELPPAVRWDRLPDRPGSTYRRAVALERQVDLLARLLREALDGREAP